MASFDVNARLDEFKKMLDADIINEKLELDIELAFNGTTRWEVDLDNNRLTVGINTLSNNRLWNMVIKISSIIFATRKLHSEFPNLVGNPNYISCVYNEIYGPNDRVKGLINFVRIKPDTRAERSDIRAERSPQRVEFKEIDSRSEQNDTYMGALEYYENSCNIDSLLMAILGTNMPIKDKIISSKYEHFTPNLYATACKDDSKITNNKDLREFAISISNEIREINSMLSKKSGIKCVNLRNTLKTCLTDMKQDHRWLYYNIENLYSLFVDLFDLEKPITMYDYMSGSTVIEDREYYIFINGGSGTIKEFNKTGVETQIIEGIPIEWDKPLKFDTEIEIADKTRRLEFVIYLLGGSYSNDTGTHYVLYFRGRNNKIYFYDDTKNALQELASFPSIIWNTHKGIPAMYGYL